MRYSIFIATVSPAFVLALLLGIADLRGGDAPADNRAPQIPQIPELPEAPEIPGQQVTRGDTVEIPAAPRPMIFRFNDGRICMPAASGSIWSDDAGKTWRDGPAGPLDKMAFDFGDGEVISISRDLVPRADGKQTVNYRHSADNWKTVQSREGVTDVPQATSAGGDAGDVVKAC
jgi:hypothetical protein